MKGLSLAFALVVLFASGGCAQRSLVGNWKAVNGPQSVTVNRDGTLVGKGTLGPATIAIGAKYTYGDDTLTVTSPDLKVAGIPETFKGMARDAMPKTMTFHVSWLGKDRIALNGGEYLNGEYVRQN